MKKLMFIMLIFSIICVGCAKNEVLQNEKVEKTETQMTSNILLNGCDDYIYMSGEDLLNLNSIEKSFSISKNIKLSILFKRGNPNGMNIYAYDKKSKYITDLMYCLENEDFDVTDEFGFPLENYYYEVAAYDVDNDNKKEIIFLAGDKNEKLVVCVLKVEKKKGQLKFNVQDVYHGEQYAYIDKNNNIQLVKLYNKSKKNSNELEHPKEELSSRDNYKIYDISKKGKLSYVYEIYDKQGNVVKKEKIDGREPIIQKVSKNYLSIAIGAGTNLILTQYYDIENNVFSEIFDCPYLVKENMVVYMKNQYTLVVRDAFDKSKYYKEFKLDFSNTAIPASLIREVKEIDDNTLEITYLSGKNYDEVIDIIKLN